MRIGKRLFPYPTINNNKSACCFKKSSYELSCEMQENEIFLILKNACIILDNIQMVELLKENKVQASIIIECSSTIYRKIFPINLEPQDIIISMYDLKGKVEISSFITAVEDFTFIDKDFLDDYSEYSFEIEKYDILAIDDGFQTKVEYDENVDKKISSIFSVIKSLDQELKIMKVTVGDKKIKIILPEKQFAYYDNLKGRDCFSNIFFSIIAIPALIKSIQEVKSESLDIGEICMEHSWFNTIVEAYKKNYNKELTSDELKKINVEELSQILLNCATVNAIEDVSNLFLKRGMEGTEEYE
ncbi:MAG: hypothetical protein RSH78_05735 [Bacilli bacterium]